MSSLDPSSLEHFRAFGWVRVRDAFDANDAATMCDVVWNALAKDGSHRNEPSTWTSTRPEHLQHLKKIPPFAQSAPTARSQPFGKYWKISRCRCRRTEAPSSS